MLLSAIIEEPEVGTWVADLELSAPYSGSFGYAGATWVGTPAGPEILEGGRYRVRVVGGAGGISKQIAEKWYYGGGTGNTIVGDVARAAGETADVTLPQRVPTWHRARVTAGQALDTLCLELGAVWWVGRDGVLRAAPSRPAGEVALSAFTRIGADVDGSINLVGEGTIAPGMSINDRVIRHLRHSYSPQRTTIEVSFNPTFLTDHRGSQTYARTHRGVVERQHPDGTLDLIVNNRFSLTRIPWLAGVPGDVTINPGDVVSVAAWGGDPRQWHAFGLSRVTGGTDVASIGDTVDCGTLLIAQSVSTSPIEPVTVVYIPPGPTHDVQVAAQRVALAALGLLFEVPLRGVIDSGNPRLKI
jgi:hypothetical protein